ncbi:MAG: 2-C-methyl-D-erythritol 4-phosphate cytidylyltransferase [Acidobacteriota bacterium]
MARRPPTRLVSALIVAAGRGQRLGTLQPKQFLSVGGMSLVERCLAAFETARVVDETWLVISRDHMGRAARLRRRFRKLRGAVAGGRERVQSVARGLACLSHDGVVLVHDAARPFVSPSLIARVTRAAWRHGAAIPALPVADTLKRAGRGAQVVRTLERRGVWAAQTPQGFRVPLLRRAYARASARGAPDDAALVERLGRRVKLVAGSPLNFKVTWKEDLWLARALIAARETR